MTAGLLIGDIQRSQEKELFVIHFRIKAPALNNYTFSIVNVRHSAQLYPATVADLASREHSGTCGDEEEFEQALYKILSSEKVRKVIAALLADIRVDRKGNESDLDDIPF
jgi:hypothetical protein